MAYQWPYVLCVHLDGSPTHNGEKVDGNIFSLFFLEFPWHEFMPHSRRSFTTNAKRLDSYLLLNEQE